MEDTKIHVAFYITKWLTPGHKSENTKLDEITFHVFIVKISANQKAFVGQSHRQEVSCKLLLLLRRGCRMIK